jgi:hypothetical protein
VIPRPRSGSAGPGRRRPQSSRLIRSFFS